MKKTICSFIQKVKESTTKIYQSAKKNVLAIAASAAAIVPATATMTVAAATEQTLINSVLQLVFKIFRYIGILLLAWSIGMLVLAFKNEDADSKSRAIMMMVVSVVLIGIEALFNGLGIVI